jgi:hypothetical protein
MVPRSDDMTAHLSRHEHLRAVGHEKSNAEILGKSVPPACLLFSLQIKKLRISTTT